jgi:hypothetical protein
MKYLYFFFLICLVTNKEKFTITIKKNQISSTLYVEEYKSKRTGNNAYTIHIEGQIGRKLDPGHSRIEITPEIDGCLNVKFYNSLRQKGSDKPFLFAKFCENDDFEEFKKYFHTKIALEFIVLLTNELKLSQEGIFRLPDEIPFIRLEEIVSVQILYQVPMILITYKKDEDDFNLKIDSNVGFNVIRLRKFKKFVDNASFSIEKVTKEKTTKNHETRKPGKTGTD